MIMEIESDYSSDTRTFTGTASHADTMFHRITNVGPNQEKQIIPPIRMQQREKIEWMEACRICTCTSHEGVGGRQKVK